MLPYALSGTNDSGYNPEPSPSSPSPAPSYTSFGPSLPHPSSASPPRPASPTASAATPAPPLPALTRLYSSSMFQSSEAAARARATAAALRLLGDASQGPARFLAAVAERQHEEHARALAAAQEAFRQRGQTLTASRAGAGSAAAAGQCGDAAASADAAATTETPSNVSAAAAAAAASVGALVSGSADTEEAAAVRRVVLAAPLTSGLARLRHARRLEAAAAAGAAEARYKARVTMAHTGGKRSIACAGGLDSAGCLRAGIGAGLGFGPGTNDNGDDDNDDDDDHDDDDESGIVTAATLVRRASIGLSPAALSRAPSVATSASVIGSGAGTGGGGGGGGPAALRPTIGSRITAHDADAARAAAAATAAAVARLATPRAASSTHARSQNSGGGSVGRAFTFGADDDNGSNSNNNSIGDSMGDDSHSDAKNKSGRRAVTGQRARALAVAAAAFVLPESVASAELFRSTLVAKNVSTPLDASERTTPPITRVPATSFVANLHADAATPSSATPATSTVAAQSSGVAAATAARAASSSASASASVGSQLDAPIDDASAQVLAAAAAWSSSVTAAANESGRDLRYRLATGTRDGDGDGSSNGGGSAATRAAAAGSGFGAAERMLAMTGSLVRSPVPLTVTVPAAKTVKAGAAPTPAAVAGSAAAAGDESATGATAAAGEGEAEAEGEMEAAGGWMTGAEAAAAFSRYLYSLPVIPSLPVGGRAGELGSDCEELSSSDGDTSDRDAAGGDVADAVQFDETREDGAAAQQQDDVMVRCPLDAETAGESLASGSMAALCSDGGALRPSANAHVTRGASRLGGSGSAAALAVDTPGVSHGDGDSVSDRDAGSHSSIDRLAVSASLAQRAVLGDRRRNSSIAQSAAASRRHSTITNSKVTAAASLEPTAMPVGNAGVTINVTASAVNSALGTPLYSTATAAQAEALFSALAVRPPPDHRATAAALRRARARAHNSSSRSVSCVTAVNPQQQVGLVAVESESDAQALLLRPVTRARLARAFAARDERARALQRRAAVTAIAASVLASEQQNESGDAHSATAGGDEPLPVPLIVAAAAATAAEGATAGAGAGLGMVTVDGESDHELEREALSDFEDNLSVDLAAAVPAGPGYLSSSDSGSDLEHGAGAMHGGHDVETAESERLAAYVGGGDAASSAFMMRLQRRQRRRLRRHMRSRASAAATATAATAATNTGGATPTVNAIAVSHSEVETGRVSPVRAGGHRYQEPTVSLKSQAASVLHLPRAVADVTVAPLPAGSIAIAPPPVFNGGLTSAHHIALGPRQPPEGSWDPSVFDDGAAPAVSVYDAAVL